MLASTWLYSLYAWLYIDRAGWAARGKYLASDVVNCTAILSYTAELVRPGLVAFTYQSEDESILFTFEVFAFPTLLWF